MATFREILTHVYGNGTEIEVLGTNGESKKTTMKDNFTFLYCLRELLKEVNFKPNALVVNGERALWQKPDMFLVSGEDSFVVFGWVNKYNHLISISTATIYSSPNRFINLSGLKWYPDGLNGAL